MIQVHDCWEKLSKSVRLKISGHHPGISSEADIPAWLTDPHYWQTYRQRLSQNEQLVLDWLAIERGEDWLTLLDLQGQALPILPIPFRLTITSLRQRGIIYAGREETGEAIYILPADVRDAWLAVRINKEGAPAYDTEIIRQARPGILHDLFHLLVMIDREGIERTAAGGVHKRAVQKMDSELETTGDPFLEAEWLTGQAKEVTGFQVVYRLAERAGWLAGEGGQPLALQQERLQSWLTLSLHDCVGDIYHVIRREWLQVHPRDAALLWWMEQQTGWVSLQAMGVFWMTLLGKSKRLWEAFIEEWTDKWLEPLHGLGWIDWGDSASGVAWRWSIFSPFAAHDQGDLPTAGYVQPNFEWLLPLHFPLDWRWQAAQFADLLQTDHMCTYDINRHSVKRALKKGWSADEMVRFLQDHSLTPVPQNVEASIRQWADEEGTVRFEPTVLLTCHSERIARELKAHPKIKSTIRRSLGATEMIMEAKDVEGLASVLEAEGYAPVLTKELFIPTTPEPAPKHTPDSPPLRVDDHYPPLEEAVPDLRQLPKLWTSHMRAYHPTTLRQLIQRAMDMQLELERAHDDEKTSHIFRPTRLFHAVDGWRVEGVNPRQRQLNMPLSEIGRVRIRVPYEV